MAKGTPSMGKRHKPVHIRCRRCGRRAYHIRKGVCAACGYGGSKRIKRYNWKVKTPQGERRR
ncbi:MAG: 50S ribosomal protein L37e [Candidatus Hadarchaeota archaeon]|nr:50S ribosomal protein L37e [Candidatus Hadarchaeota archaeon]